MMRVDELPIRLGDKVIPEPMSGCWLFTGSLFNGYGYGYDERTKKTRLAHRIVYELLVGPVPGGLQIDHLCRNRACVNPQHMEPVTLGENVLRGIGPTAINARKTRCVRGHKYSHRDKNQRFCRECRDLAVKRYLARKAQH